MRRGALLILEIVQMLEISEETFEREVLAPAEPVLVEFWSTWCASCRLQEHVMAELDAHYRGRARFGKVKMEENQKLAIQYRIMSAPTLLLFVGGEVRKRFNGFQKWAPLAQAVDDALAG